MKCGREKIFFTEDTRDSWYPKLDQLSKLNLPAKSIADSFGCSYATLTNSESAMDIVRKGWSFYRARIEFELWALATEVPGPNADSVEKASIRISKTKALGLIHKVLHAEQFVPPAEHERIRRLSDEDLKKELQKHLEGKEIISKNTGL